MEFIGEYRFNASALDVWLALNDPEVLKRTIPGCDTMERITPTDYAGQHAHNLYVNAGGVHSHGLAIDAGGSHSHNVGVYGDGNHQHNVIASMGAAGGHQHTITTDWQGGTETRPRNVAFLACIKY